MEQPTICPDLSVERVLDGLGRKADSDGSLKREIELVLGQIATCLPPSVLAYWVYGGHRLRLVQACVAIVANRKLEHQLFVSALEQLCSALERGWMELGLPKVTEPIPITEFLADLLIEIEFLGVFQELDC